MGWANGSELMDKVIVIAQKHIKNDNVRKKFYIDMINAFTDMDWDCESDCYGQDKAFDAALDKLCSDLDKTYSEYNGN